MKKCRDCKKEIDDKASKCPYCQSKQGNWAKRHPILTGIIGIVAFFIVVKVSGDGNSSTSTLASPTPPTESVQNVDSAIKTPTVEEKSNETTSQKNAVRKANSYLIMTGFSKRGLIKQLEFEKFSTEDATYAVNNIKVDWNEQAAKKAKSYNDLSGFSRDQLIKQLEFEGFTAEQAAFGADSVGL